MKKKLLTMIIALGVLGSGALIAGNKDAYADTLNVATVNCNVLNFRNGPSLNAGIQGELYQGQNVTVLNNDGNWDKISVNNNIGYVYNEYLTSNGSNNIQSMSGNGYVNVQGLNFRPEPTLNCNVITVLGQNTQVQITGKIGNWYKVVVNGQSGYLYASYVTEGNNGSSSNQNVQSMNGSGYVNVQGLNFRPEPTTNCNVITVLGENTPVQITGKIGNWYKVVVNGQSGYLYASYVTEGNNGSSSNQNVQNMSGNGYVNVQGLNFRPEPTTNCNVITVLGENTPVQITGKIGNWYKVVVNGQSGYLYASYVTEGNNGSSSNQNVQSMSGNGYVNVQGLNFRPEPTTNCNVITVLGENTPVQITGKIGNWYKVVVNGQSGYLYASYVTQGNAPSNSNQGNTPNQADWVANLNVAKTTNQLVTVQVHNFDQATVEFHQKNSNGQWNEVFSTQGYIGYGGLINPNTRVENDGTTPAGVYTFGTAFGSMPNPGTQFTYNKLHNGSYWNGNYGTKNFNEYVNYYPGPDCENLWANEAVAYKYALSINFNTFNPRPDVGNAIFLHCSVGGPTAGCVAIPQYRVKQLLRTLSPSAKIVISTTNGIMNY